MALAALAAVAAPPALRAETRVWNTLLFGGLDAGSTGNAFAYAGALVAPFADAERSGWRLRGFAGAGRYDYRSGAATIRGRILRGDLLVGWQTIAGPRRIALFAGLDGVEHRLSPADPASRVAGAAVGAKVRLEVAEEIWSGAHGFFAAEVSTARRTWSLYAKLAQKLSALTGQTAFADLAFGPEAAAGGDAGSDQWRLGLQLEGMRLGSLNLGLAAGYLRNTRRNAAERGGLYGRFGFWTTF